MGTRDAFPGVEASSKADHSPSSSADVKNEWSYTSIPLYVFVAYKEAVLPLALQRYTP